VDHKGNVFWSRPGHLLAACKFGGLDEFPFDALKCTLEFGSWAYSGLYLRPTKMGGEGFSVGGSETAGESFAEYSLGAISVEEKVYPPFPGDPESDWPVLLYHVTFERAWQPYARGFLVVQVLLNLIAFGCFWLPPQSGERMSLAITAMLAAVASELTISAQLPRASEATWFSRFSLTTTMFSSLVLVESSAVVYFHYHTGDELVPRWYRSLQAYLGLRDKEEGNMSRTGSDRLREVNKSWTEMNYNTNDDDDDDDDGNNIPVEEAASEEKSRPSVSFEPQKPEMDCSFSSHPENPKGETPVEIADMPVIPDVSDSQNEIDCSRRPQMMTRQQNFHSNLTGSTRAGIKTVLGRDADDFKDVREMENNLRWQAVSRNIDDFSRVVFPVGYAIFLGFAFGW